MEKYWKTLLTALIIVSTMFLGLIGYVIGKSSINEHGISQPPEKPKVPAYDIPNLLKIGD